MADTFRALCAELAALDGHCVVDCSEDWANVMCRVRTALAQPETEGPTDEELIQLAIDTRLYRFQATAGDPVQYEMTERQVHAFARAVLARWGRPAIESVPKREDAHYAWELHDAEGQWQAGGSANSLEDVQREGSRYLQTYSQDGPHKLIIERHCVTTIEPEPQGPTDEELLDLHDLHDAWNAQADAAGRWFYELGTHEIIRFAQRQALARWGRPLPTDTTP